MPGKRGRPKKNPYDLIDEEWKNAVNGATPADINSRISEVAKAEELNQRLKGEDEDLANRKAEAKDAGQQYADATKVNKLKITYAVEVLKGKGGA